MVKDWLVPVVNHPDSGQRHRLQAGRTHLEGSSHVPAPQLIWESLLPWVTTAAILAGLPAGREAHCLLPAYMPPLT